MNATTTSTTVPTLLGGLVVTVHPPSGAGWTNGTDGTGSSTSGPGGPGGPGGLGGLKAGQGGPVPLVLGHGLFLDSSMWDEVQAVAAFDRVVVTIDGPGHGRSDVAPRGWTLAQHATALLQVMDALDLPRAVLAGHSWAGMVALRAAHAAPERVAGLGLINTPLAATTGLSRLTYRARQLALRAAGPGPFFARRAAAALYAPESLSRRPELLERAVARLAGRSGGDLADTMRAVILDATDTASLVAGVPAPVLVLAGHDDYVLPPTTRATLHATAPRTRVVITAGGHISPEEAPAQVAAALTQLMDDVDGPLSRP